MSILKKYTEKKNSDGIQSCTFQFYIVLLHVQKMHEEDYSFGIHTTTQLPLYASFRKGDFLCHLH